MKLSRRTTEYLIYSLFWGALILVPFWSMNNGIAVETIDWDKALKYWTYLLPALVLFFINNNVLMPFLLYKKGGRRYLLYLICLIALFYFGFISVMSMVRSEQRPPVAEMRLDLGMPQPPPIGRHKKPPVQEAYVKLQKMQHTVHDFFTDNYSYRIKMPPHGALGRKTAPNAFVYSDSVQLLLVVFTLIFNICVRLFFLNLRNEEHLKELEKQKLRTELEYLKYQINPHFFMNTLNNIHALIDIDKRKAQNSVIELSKMMRHVLYDAPSSFVTLAKEVEFLNSYIDLMRLRYTDSLKVECSFPCDVDGHRIPSLLFVSFVENAFKHGVSYNGKSFIKAVLSVDDKFISFFCSNSCVAQSESGLPSHHSGIGIDNVRKRLSLIYGEDYSLEIKRDKSEFCVILKIPVSNDKMYIG